MTAAQVKELFRSLSAEYEQLDELRAELSEYRRYLLSPRTASPHHSGGQRIIDGMERQISHLDFLQRQVALYERSDPREELERLIDLLPQKEKVLRQILRMLYLERMRPTEAVEILFGVQRDTPAFKTASRRCYRMRDKGFQMIAARYRG